MAMSDLSCRILVTGTRVGGQGLGSLAKFSTNEPINVSINQPICSILIN